ncbi:MAG: hypothetical protein ACMG6E_09960, partial [Candidatus Roizmanbacteria bacterium]
MAKEGENKVINLAVLRGASWDSSSPFTKAGTLADLITFFRHHMATGYRFGERGTELVPPQFFQGVGNLLITALEHADLLKITGTLQSWNDHRDSTGKPRVVLADPNYSALLALESAEFRRADPKDRLATVQDFMGFDMLTREAESIKATIRWIAGSSYMHSKDGFNDSLEMSQTYPKVIPGVRRIWNKE